MVQQIIKEFDELFKVLDTFDKENFYDWRRGSWMFYPHKGNVRVAANIFASIANLWATHRAALHTWMVTYFEENKQEIYNKFYLDAGWKLMSDNLNPHWRFKEADEDFLTNCPDLMAWRAAEELVRAARPRMAWSNCDDQEILRKHEGVQCNGGLICILCDDMEHDWCDKIEAEVRRADNIFLNKASRAAFAGREAATWTGPTRPPLIEDIFPRIEGKTPFQAMKALIEHMHRISYTFNSYCNQYEDYELFLRFWSKYEYIDYNIEAYRVQAAEIVTLLE
jgi:hypothetical protein